MARRNGATMRATLAIAALMLAGTWVGIASAGIPEPDAVYFGSVRIDGVLQGAASGHQVELRSGATVLASYALGDDPGAGDLYLLRVPVEASVGGGGPSGVARIGDEGTLFVNGVAAARLYLGARGRITRVDLDASSTAAPDFDADGVADFLDLCPGSPQQTDSDGNGIADACEGVLNPERSAVAVGLAGNPADPATGLGAVDYEFGISETEVTNAEYVEFLSAVAATDPNGLYNPAMAADPRGGIVRSGSSGAYSYRVKPNMANKPVNFVSWLDAARYANWVRNREPTGAQGVGTTETGAFDLRVDEPGANATWVDGEVVSLPVEDEWYKAAFYDPARGGSDYWLYPTRQDVPPVSAAANAIGDVSNPGPGVANYDEGASWDGQVGNLTTVASAGAAGPFGTSDQGGNVGEWLADDAESGLRVVRGGSYQDAAGALESTADQPDRGAVLRDPAYEGPDVGIRLVPEPSELMLAAASLLGVGVLVRRAVASARAG